MRKNETRYRGFYPDITEIEKEWATSLEALNLEERDATFGEFLKIHYNENQVVPITKNPFDISASILFWVFMIIVLIVFLAVI